MKSVKSYASGETILETGTDAVAVMVKIKEGVKAHAVDRHINHCCERYVEVLIEAEFDSEGLTIKSPSTLQFADKLIYFGTEIIETCHICQR